jgi:hypothetical protein
MTDRTISGQLDHVQAYASGDLEITETVSGGVPAGLNYTVQADQLPPVMPGPSLVRDIFKDGAGAALTAECALIDLKEAIHPLACEDCGHVEEMSVGDVEHCLLEAQEAIKGLAPHQWGEWTSKLFQLLWESRDLFHKDWLEGLRQCPKKGWAGLTLLEMRAGMVMEAWETLHIALRGDVDADDD